MLYVCPIRLVHSACSSFCLFFSLLFFPISSLVIPSSVNLTPFTLADILYKKPVTEITGVQVVTLYAILDKLINSYYSYCLKG